MARLIDSKRDGKLLVYQNFIYQYHSCNKAHTRKYWRCERRLVCTGRCVTNYAVEQGVEIFKVKRHEHEEESWNAQVREITNNIKRRARENPNDPPGGIVADEVGHLVDEEVIMNLPEQMALLRQVNRHQNRTRPPLPQRLADINIIHPYDQTLQNENFLQFDSGINDRNRLMIFYSRPALEWLARSRIIYCDGTFKTVPKQFYQMYTMHGVVYGHVFPLVYSLTSRKTQETYETIFRHVKREIQNLGLQMNVRTVTTDFELAAMNAARVILRPRDGIHGCLFHFSQSLWRYAVTECRLKVN